MQILTCTVFPKHQSHIFLNMSPDPVISRLSLKFLTLYVCPFSQGPWWLLCASTHLAAYWSLATKTLPVSSLTYVAREVFRPSDHTPPTSDPFGFHRALITSLLQATITILFSLIFKVRLP